MKRIKGSVSRSELALTTGADWPVTGPILEQNRARNDGPVLAHCEYDNTEVHTTQERQDRQLKAGQQEWAFTKGTDSESGQNWASSLEMRQY